MEGGQGLVSSGDGCAWLLTTRQSEGSEAGMEMEMRVKMKTSGSETSAGLANQMNVEKGRRAAEHPRRDAAIGMLGTQER